MSKNRFSVENPEGRREAADFLKRHKIAKYITELYVRSAIHILAFATKDLNMKKMKDPAHVSGLIEGAIIGPSLCFPLEEDGDLSYKQAGAGQWIGYDFNRPAEFPAAHKKKPMPLQSEGKLMYFPLEEIMDNPGDERTPTSMFSFFNLNHVLRYDSASTEQLLEQEFVIPTTYEEAYDAAGLYDRYAEDLASRQLSAHNIYSVTPKGNTLISLVKPRGQSSPKREPEPEFSLTPGLRTT